MSKEMFSIKVVTPPHFGGDNPACFKKRYPENDMRKPLMNFRKETTARRFQHGHKSIVYVSKWQRFIWAIEFQEVNEPDSYDHLLKPWNMKRDDLDSEWKFIREFRFLASMDESEKYEKSPHLAAVQKQLGEPDWKPSHGIGHRFISKAFYDKLFGVIPWDWQSPNK